MRKLVVPEFISLDGVIQARGVRTRIPTEASPTAGGSPRTGMTRSATHSAMR